MAAYAAVISLKHTINGLLNSSRIIPDSSSREILKSAYDETTSLQQALERWDDSSVRWSSSSSERLDALEGQIRDCAHKLEDILEFYELNSQEEKNIDEEVNQDITSFAETMKEMEKGYIQELSRDDDDDDDAAIVSSNIDSGVDTVGHSIQFTTIRDHLLRRLRPHDTCFLSFFGENGSGRTMAAKTIFEDLCKGTKQFFDCCAWVTIGTIHQLKEGLMNILAHVDDLAAGDYELLISKEEEELCNCLYKSLENRRYMIVLDDVRDVQVVDYFRTSLPDQSNGSLVFLNTGLEEVAELTDLFYTFEQTAPHIFLEQMWYLLRTRTFGLRVPMSLELKEAGKKIIENCRGRPISVAKTALFLMNSEKTVEQWSKIAADKENPIFMLEDEPSEISKIETKMQSYNWEINDKRRILIEDISQLNYCSKKLDSIKKKTHPERFFPTMQILSLLGMAGIGKSTFARKVFEDELVSRYFDHRVWIKLGPKYRKEEILMDILAQIYPNMDKLQMKGDEKLVRELCVQLSSKRCLIVLDDLCSNDPLIHLKTRFPNIKGTSLVTTRLAQVAKLGGGDINDELALLDKEESWSLLRQKVFGEEFCPPKLERVGRKIVDKCDGLPLLILAVANQLLEVERSEEYWNNVALGKEKSVFENALNEISKPLLPSYRCLPQHLKACFLYMGIFLEKYEIPISNLTNLWIAEGFLETDGAQKVEDFIAECLSDLVDRSLVMVQSKDSDLQIKTCRLHPVFWHLSNSEAVNNKFFHAMNSYGDCFMESMKSQRRLCIRNSILLGLKDVQESMASITSAHSLLCVSPLQQYPVNSPLQQYPVNLNFDMRLLRVMNALTIRLYEFPVEVVKLIHLTYLGLTCDGKLPTSISNLWKLEYLIVKQYINITSSEDSCTLPAEIWDMKELKHLQVMGGLLPDNKSGVGSLKLSTLLDVNPLCFRKEVLEWIPNLKKLGIRIELAPDDKGISFLLLNNIGRFRCLCGLESLKCVVVNPEITSEFVPMPPAWVFPSSLKKLSLSGLGYPWQYMRIISTLPNLEVLKLKHYAFQGPKWEMEYSRLHFGKLKFLSIQDTDLMIWKNNSPITMELERLCIKHCYQLEDLPTLFLNSSFKAVEIVDCNPLAMTWAKQMKETLIYVEAKGHLSWIDNTRTRHE